MKKIILLICIPVWTIAQSASTDTLVYYGSMDKFLAQEMELSPEKLVMLRAKYVQ